MKKQWILIVIVFTMFIGVYSVVKWNMLRSAAENSKSMTTESLPLEERITANETPQQSDVSNKDSVQLLIITPTGNSTVSTSSLSVQGKTSANAEVFVNDQETTADANGNFSVILTLDEGENYILVVANESSGNYTEKEFTVTYNP